MALQFIGTRESLKTECPGAGEGPFAGMPPQMGFQMAGLTVYFVARFYMANVGFLAVGAADDGWKSGHFIDAVGAIATRASLLKAVLVCEILDFDGGVGILLPIGVNGGR